MGSKHGTRLAAKVFLSAYNGDAYQLNIVDLCKLDKNQNGEVGTNSAPTKQISDNQVY